MSKNVLILSTLIGVVAIVVSVVIANAWLAILTIAALSFFQNISFTIVSRSRNRDNLTYHMIASIFSNGVWFLTFRELILQKMSFVFFVPYTVGTVVGSLTGQKIAMWIEKKLGALSDSHITDHKDKK